MMSRKGVLLNKNNIFLRKKTQGSRLIRDVCLKHYNVYSGSEIPDVGAVLCISGEFICSLAPSSFTVYMKILQVTKGVVEF